MTNQPREFDAVLGGQGDQVFYLVKGVTHSGADLYAIEVIIPTGLKGIAALEFTFPIAGRLPNAAKCHSIDAAQKLLELGNNPALFASVAIVRYTAAEFRTALDEYNNPR